MGIKESYDQLRAEAQERVNDSNREQKLRQLHEHIERSKREWESEWKKQVVLLRELQGLGVIGMIEEFTGEKMEILEEDRVERIGYDRPRYDKVLDENYDVIQVPEELGWSWEVVSPDLSENGIWNPALRIRLGKIDDLIYGNFNGDSVILAYHPSKDLEIMGQEVTYRGELPQDSIARTTLVETKLAQALVNPIPARNVLSRLYPETFGNSPRDY